MKTRRLCIALIFLLAVSVPSLRAENRDFTLKVEAGTDYLFGYTQYGIGWRFYDVAGTPYLIGFEISRLKFPLNSLTFYANAEMTLFQVIMLSLHFDKNLTAAPGKMEDSDWGVWYLNGNTWADPASLDYYSLSDEALNAFSINASLHYVLPLESIFSFSFGLGFIFQYIYCEERNTDQWNPSYQQYSAYLDPSYGDHDYFPQLVGTYRVEYFIPLAEAEVGLHLGDVFSVSLLAGFSPLVFAIDADDHILRSKLANGDSRGVGVRSRLSLRFNFTSWLYAGAEARFLFIHAEGKQTQFQYNDTKEGPAGPLGSVDTKLDSLQFSAGIHIGISF